MPSTSRWGNLDPAQVPPRNPPVPFREWLTGLIGETLYGVPVAGPALLGLGERLQAGKRSLMDDVPYSQALEEAQTRQENFRRDQPRLSESAQAGGSALGMTVPGPGLGQQLIGNAALGGLDAMVRGQDPGTAAVVGGIAGATHVPAIFAGMAAKTANREMLTLATDLKNGGFTPEEIWKETGWFQGADDKWRFEIDDSASRVPDKTIDALMRRGSHGSKAGVAGEILEHPELYKAYPELQNIDTYADYGVNYPGSSGSYDQGFPATEKYFGRSPQINMELNALAGPEGPRSIMLHELQHPIQRIEGFATGGSPAEFGGMGGYRRLAGEVEARNVQARRRMTAEERRATPPWTTEDELRALQNVRGVR